MSIPRHFHFIFGLKEQNEPFHLVHYLCLQSCLEVNQPQYIYFHYRSKPWGPLWDLIEPHLTLQPLDESLPQRSLVYPDASDSKAYSYAHTTDFLRVAVLNREGGVYADMDTLFIRPYPDNFYQYPFLMGLETVDPKVVAGGQAGSLCNALILAEAGSQFGRIWESEMETSFDGSWCRHCTFLPYDLSRAYPETIRVEPESSFFFLDWTKRGVHRLFKQYETLPEHVYSLHLWAHLWWARERTDVSRFHAGRVTPEYVAYAGTTYARYARRFLPAQLEPEGKGLWMTRYLLGCLCDFVLETKDRVAGRVRALIGRG